MTGIVFGEQPRWHDGRLWFSDWGTQEVIAVDLDGNAEVMHRGSSFPLCVDWLPDGRLLVVDTSTGRLLVQEADGSLVPYGDLRQGSDPPAGNELVVDGRGNAYVNGGGFDLMAGEPFAPEIVAAGHPRRVGPTGRRRARLPQWHGGDRRQRDPDRRRVLCQAADRLRHRRRRRPDRTGASGPTSATASPTASASTPRAPSGTPTSRTSAAFASAKAARCSQTVDLDRGVLRLRARRRGPQTLYILATEWNGPENMFKGQRTGKLLTVTVALAAGWQVGHAG